MEGILAPTYKVVIRVNKNNLSSPEMLIVPPPCSFLREGSSCLAIQTLPPTFQSVVSPFLGNVISLPHDPLVMSGCSSFPRPSLSDTAWVCLAPEFRVCSLSLPSSLTPPSSSWEDFDFFYPFKEFASLLISRVSTDVCVCITAHHMKTQLVLYRSQKQWPPLPNFLV